MQVSIINLFAKYFRDRFWASGLRNALTSIRRYCPDIPRHRYHGFERVVDRHTTAMVDSPRSGGRRQVGVPRYPASSFNANIDSEEGRGNGRLVIQCAGILPIEQLLQLSLQVLRLTPLVCCFKCIHRRPIEMLEYI
jgi:hypothetical protein